MKAYEITYKYNGEQYRTIEMSKNGWDSLFVNQVLDRIESLVCAGAVVTDLREVIA